MPHDLLQADEFAKALSALLNYDPNAARDLTELGPCIDKLNRVCANEGRLIRDDPSLRRVAHDCLRMKLNRTTVKGELINEISVEEMVQMFSSGRAALLSVRTGAWSNGAFQQAFHFCMEMAMLLDLRRADEPVEKAD